MLEGNSCDLREFAFIYWTALRCAVSLLLYHSGESVGIEVRLFRIPCSGGTCKTVVEILTFYQTHVAC